jgi:hypothetical protein
MFVDTVLTGQNGSVIIGRAFTLKSMIAVQDLGRLLMYWI